MRRERRRFDRNDTDIKRILYTAGGILFISITIRISINSNNSQEEQRLAMFNTEMMGEKVAQTVLQKRQVLKREEQ